MIRKDLYNWIDIDNLAKDVLRKDKPTLDEQILASYIVDNKIVDRVEIATQNNERIEELDVLLSDAIKGNEEELRSVLKETRDALNFLYWEE